MRYLAPLLLLLSYSAFAQGTAFAQTPANALVVSGCGTPNGTYVIGQNQPETQDTTGLLCVKTSGSSGGAVTQGTTPWIDSISFINGILALAGAGATGTGSLRVTIAQDATTISGSAPGTSGTPSANVVTVQGPTSGGTPIPTTATTTPGQRTLVTLDVKTVTTGGTAVNAISAGHRTAGGFLTNPVGATVALCINEIGTATGTVSSGDTTCITPGQSYGVAAAAGAVSVISSDSSHPFSGYGLQ